MPKRAKQARARRQRQSRTGRRPGPSADSIARPYPGGSPTPVSASPATTRPVLPEVSRHWPVTRELKRIGLIAGSLLIVLVVLSFVLR